MSNNLIDLKKRFPKRRFNIDLESFETTPPDDFLYRFEKLLFRPHLYSSPSAKIVLLDTETRTLEPVGWEEDRSSSARRV
jgi:hypothetical protein